MLYLTICDDENTQLSLLESYVGEWARERRYEADIALCRNAEEFLFRWEEGQQMDILLLDIDMPGMDGLSLARRLRGRGEEAQIIFVTGLSDYALEGYDVEAVSYLLKPVKRERLYACLDRAKARCGREEPALLLDTPGGMARVKCKDVCYLESADHDTQVHSVAGAEVLRCRTGIRQMEERLEGAGQPFFRIHRSYLVNLAYVNRIARKEVVMDNGEALPVAKNRWEALNRAYLEYYREKQVFS